MKKNREDILDEIYVVLDVFYKKNNIFSIIPKAEGGKL